MNCKYKQHHSTSTLLISFVSLESNFFRIKSSFFTSNQSPLWSRIHVVQSSKWLSTCNQFMKLVIINPCIPHSINFELLLCNQNAARMLVFTAQLIIFLQERRRINKKLSKFQNFLMKWDILHCQGRCFGSSTIGYSLYLNKTGAPFLHKFRIIENFFHVPLFDQGQSKNSSLPLLAQRINASKKSFPKICKNRTINFLEAFLGRGIYTYIKLSYWLQCINFIWKLCVCNHKRRYLFLVQQINKFVDMRVNNWFSN
mmetsp:Transcript_18920/g.26450  ORF Transcript_18920/g.26450 Transcript_18920/m.26450 type:complete len:256 (-) Transcript_18920:1012-1779(-)